MITFVLNGEKIEYTGSENNSLLKYLRLEKGITSAKDGCSAQSACGACMVEINGEAKLACVTLMKKLEHAEVTTMEGMDEPIKEILAKAFVEKGAVQCGFCTPGFLMRTKVLLHKNQMPTKDEIKQALTLNLCRCTGYTKIIQAIECAAKALHEDKTVDFSETSGAIGSSYPKYQALATAVGKRKFVNDMTFEGMAYGALRFSDHPRAKVLKIDVSEALNLKGVQRIFTDKDIPGNKKIGLIFQDWPLMIGEGEITHYIGDVLAGVVADTEDIAREAAKLVKVDYDVMQPVTDPYEALLEEAPQVHEDRPNLLSNCKVYRDGDAEEILKGSAYVSKGRYTTQRIEHGFLETEACIALPEDDGVHLYTNGQGIYVDRKQVAQILNLPLEKVHVTLVPTGGGFGGKEDMTVQGHTALFAYHLQKPVKVVLSREDSFRMHPKRHPVTMDIAIGCDKDGMFTAAKLMAVGDGGAYASVGNAVMERVAGHTTGGYHFPCCNLEALEVYTNNVPCGAMRGFGANQAAFALESCIDELCKMGGFDRWQFRYDNALTEGRMTATGHVLKAGVGIRACLDKLKPFYESAKHKGIACAIKNSGVGCGMVDDSDVLIKIVSENKIELHHGWTEMGQGIHNMAIQSLTQETGINPDIVDVFVDSDAGIPTGMTTSSRATALLGNAIIDASIQIKKDLEKNTLQHLSGKSYKGNYTCDWTTQPGADVKEVITHYSYGYAAQLVVLNDAGDIETVYAAHDAGKIMNPVMFEGQIEGAVHMGLGYALTEDFPMKDGQIVSYKMRDLGILKAKETPDIVVLGVEVEDPVGPYGAKGLGEIGLVPTAAAVANALSDYDGIRRYSLPMKRKK
jgi:aldehyde oxidoreductase